MGRGDQKGGSRVATKTQVVTTEAEDLVLERKASGAALQELYRMEVELHRRYRAHLARNAPQPSEAKDRILAGLRSKD